jgi:hypothetical protein
MAKGPIRKPKADSTKRTAGAPKADAAPAKSEPSEMYKLFTKGRSFE